jgi:hypothetical protein
MLFATGKIISAVLQQIFDSFLLPRQNILHPVTRVMQSNGRLISNKHKDRLIRALRGIGLFLLGLCFSAALFQLVTPHRVLPGTGGLIDVKFLHFKEHKNDYNNLFLGSSILFRHIDPSVFDETLNEVGHSSQSFNFGAAAMKLFETRFLLHELIKLQPQNLEHVFIEINPDGLFLSNENGRKPRAVYYHDLENILFITKYVLSSDIPLLEKASFIQQHITPFFYNFTNLGYLHQRLFVSEKTAPKSKWLGKNFDGFVPLDDVDPENKQERRQRFLEDNKSDTSSFQKRVDRQERMVTNLNQRRAQGSPSSETSLPEHKQELFQSLADEIRSVGAEPVFLIPPAIYTPDELKSQEDLMVAHQEGMIGQLFSHRNPQEYPDLFQFKNRFDKRYLNRKGARAYTKALSQEFTQLLEE